MKEKIQSYIKGILPELCQISDRIFDLAEMSGISVLQDFGRISGKERIPGGARGRRHGDVFPGCV